LNTNVSVSERPVTQQGLSGMRVSTAGPKRQVQDTSYFISLLRTKCNDISSETKKLKKEFEKNQTDSANFVKYERQYEELMKTLRNLEGKLADYNLAMDKSRDSTDPEDVRAYQRQLAQRNSREKEAIDAIFIERQHCEDAIRSYDDKLQKVQQMEEYKVGRLGEQDQKQYYQLAKENQQLNRALGGRVNELDNIRRRVKQGEAALGNDRYREEYVSLAKKLEKYIKEKEHLELELEESNLDPKEARERLLNKVKTDNQKIQELQTRTEDLVAETESKRKQVSEILEDVSERQRGGQSGDAEKYQMLFERDKEMSEFLEHHDEYVMKELEEQKKSQKIIVALLEHTSRSISREQNLPTSEQFSEMKDSLSFKKRQLESSMSTQDQLEKELEKRKGELEKINTLDSKIQVELSSLTSRIQVMNSEMIQFEKIDELREQAENTRQRLSFLKKFYSKRRDELRLQVGLHSSECDKKLKKIQDSEVGKTLQGLEQKLRHYEQSIFHLNDFIKVKELETQFQSEKEECGKFIDELNSLHIQFATASY